MKNLKLHFCPRDPSGKDPLKLFDRLSLTAEIRDEMFYCSCEIHKPIEQLSAEEIVEAIGGLAERMNLYQEEHQLMVPKNKFKVKGKTVSIKKRR